MSGGLRKEKSDIFLQLAFVYILSGQLKSHKWKQHTHSRLFVMQKKIARFGRNVVNAFWC